MLLMIDNYDSFTFNLVQYFGELGQDVKVVRNDEITVAEIGALQPDHLVLSPGPCSPAEAGVCVAAIQGLIGKLPILGVCLGPVSYTHLDVYKRQARQRVVALVAVHVHAQAALGGQLAQQAHALGTLF